MNNAYEQETPRAWRVERVEGRMVRRAADGRFALPVRIRQGGEPVAETAVLLSTAEAELLHAALCRALDGEPLPDNPPDCRYPSQGGHQRRNPRRDQTALESPWATER